MATQQLVVELDAKTAELDTKLKKTESNFDTLGNASSETDKEFKKFTTSAKGAAVAIAATTAATILLVSKTAEYSKELKVAATRNNSSIKQMQELSFAVGTVGISLEKLGDIGKDTSEKVGEFIATGGGGFKDFADVMGLTSVEAKELAKDFEHMSGTDVLQEMVTRMEEGGASAKEMSFALEGMASDTTDLIPLLRDGGKEIERLGSAMADVTVPLTDEDIKKLAELDEALTLAAKSAESLATQTLVTLSDWFINAANAASFFFATLNEGSRADLQTKLLPVLEGITEVEEKLKTAGGAEKNRLERLLARLTEERETIVKSLAELDSNITAPETQSTDIGGVGGADDEDSPVIQKINREVEAIKDRFKTEQELLEKKFEEEKALLDVEIENITERNELKLQLLQEFEDNSAAIKQAARDKEQEVLNKADKDRDKKQKKLDKDKKKQDKIEGDIAKQNASRDEKFAQDAMTLASLVFEDNKNVSAGIALVNTAQGVTKALSTQDYAGAAITGVMGAAQIAAILGASKGGGSIPSVSSAPPPTQQQDFQQETSSLELSDASAGGAQTLNITVPDGDELGEAIANWLNKAQITGNA